MVNSLLKIRIPALGLRCGCSERTPGWFNSRLPTCQFRCRGSFLRTHENSWPSHSARGRTSTSTLADPLPGFALRTDAAHGGNAMCRGESPHDTSHISPQPSSTLTRRRRQVPVLSPAAHDRNEYAGSHSSAFQRWHERAAQFHVGLLPLQSSQGGIFAAGTTRMGESYRGCCRWDLKPHNLKGSNTNENLSSRT